MLDDVDDKIRRNLLVFSFFVVAAWWLELPLEWPLSYRDSFNNVNRTHLLTLALAVQIYLLLRYRFSRATIKCFNEYKVEASILFRRKLESYIANKTTNFTKNLDSSLFSPRLQLYVENEEQDDAFGDGLHNKLVALKVTDVKFKDRWSGTVSCTRTLIGSSNFEIHRDGGHYPEFIVGKSHRALVWLRVLAHIVFYTRGAIELTLPAALGILSCITIFAELCNVESIQVLLRS